MKRRKRSAGNSELERLRPIMTSVMAKTAVDRTDGR